MDTETRQSIQSGRNGRSAKWPLRLIIAFSILAVSAGIGGFYYDQSALTRPSDGMADNPAVRDFAKAVDLIEGNYAGASDKERLTRGAVLGMLHSLDPHSSFYGRREFGEMQDETNSHFYGIGVTINQRNGRLYVLGVSQGMPAERAGLRYGDAIIAVDGQPTKDWSQSDALKHVRGEPGGEVRLTIERAGAPEPLTVAITRGEVPFPSVRNFFMLRPGVGYIGLTGGFNQETSEELRDAISKLKEEGMNSLILDLRRNPGGLLEQAVQVAQIFLPKGMEIVSVRGREGRYSSPSRRSDNPNPETMPLVLLINGETASASEIVAAALQDWRRGRLVGEESFGKGLVQTVYQLRWGTGLTLTTARYYTPNGRSIQRPYNGVGIYDYYVAGRGEESPAKRSSRSRSKSQSGSQPGAANVKRNAGGITPDVIVKIPDSDIHLRDACFEFARLLVAGQIPGLGEYTVKRIEYGYQLRGNECHLTDQVIAAFRNFIRERRELQVNEDQLNRNIEYARLRIRAEMITAAYGMEVGERFLIESDDQALRAIEEIPKAQRITDQARLFSPSPSPPLQPPPPLQEER
ncbi:MAG: S41 family peptidase [Blastocatellia bacterium]|nr:S41 family peptidase [Blastocatellia bacterium]